MSVTDKELRSFKAMLADKWAPSANDNYNIATFGMSAARFYELRRILDDKYGMRCFWPNKITKGMFS